MDQRMLFRKSPLPSWWSNSFTKQTNRIIFVWLFGLMTVVCFAFLLLTLKAITFLLHIPMNVVANLVAVLYVATTIALFYFSFRADHYAIVLLDFLDRRDETKGQTKLLMKVAWPKFLYVITRVPTIVAGVVLSLSVVSLVSAFVYSAFWLVVTFVVAANLYCLAVFVLGVIIEKVRQRNAVIAGGEQREET